MNTIDVKEQVRRALATEWPGFAQRHPRLAEVLEEDLLIEQATAALAVDPAYQQAMSQAGALGTGVQAATDIILRFVSNWLQRLV
jgi:hypothetical protein